MMDRIKQKYEGKLLFDAIEAFDFVFSLHLMKTILGVTNELSRTLQKKDQDIVNAMNLVKVCKEQLQMIRDNEWDSLFMQIVTFCENHNIKVLDMNDNFSSSKIKT